MTQETTPEQKGPGSGARKRPFSWLSDGLGWRARALLQKARGARATLEVAARHAVDFRESETKLIGDSQTYWNSSKDGALKQNSHWRGVGIFADDSRWLTLGREHLELYLEFARAVDWKLSPRRIIEWGCGGGMNAFHFAGLADSFYGVDISPSSLEECGKQVGAAGLQNFTPVLIDAGEPELALRQVQNPCELFISTYVFELLPTPEYGIRVLRIAYELLAPGGMAIIQIKYNEGDAKTRSRAWSYARNLAWNSTYRIEDFWRVAYECGFTPRLVRLQPQQPLVNDRNYAYFLLEKEAVVMERPASGR